MTLLTAFVVAIAAGAATLVVWRHIGPDARVADDESPSPAPRARPRRDQWLRQAGVDFSPLELWGLAAGGAGTTFVLLALATRAPLVALLPGAGVGVLPFAYLGHRRRVRLRAWQAAWPDALRELVAAIVAGRSLAHAINALGETGPDPLREVFVDFPALARVFGTAAALEQVKERMADPTSDRVIEILLVAHDRGGSIVRDILGDLVVATTKDLKVIEEIETEGLEMRINARAVLVLPWLVLVALTLRAGPFREFYRSSVGMLVIGGAGMLSALGAWWLDRLGAQPREPRVFAPTGRGPVALGGGG